MRKTQVTESLGALGSPGQALKFRISACWCPGGSRVPVRGSPLEYLGYERGFPGGSDSEESACHVGDLGSIPGSGRSPGEGNGNPLQYCCLEEFMDRGAWRATAMGMQSA